MDCQKDQSRETPNFAEILHICVDSDTRHALASLAYVRRETISKLVREAIGAYLVRPPRDVRPPPVRIG